MAYNFPWQQPAIPNYFNTNYSVTTQNPSIIAVQDELAARNAQFPMDGTPVYFANANAQEVYSKQLSMTDGSIIFKRYKVDAEPKTQPYVTHDELDAKFEELYQLIGNATAPKGEKE